MASKALKGLTIKIGGDTSELTKSLEKVEKQSRDLSGELGQINKLLKLDPKNTELLAQKQKVLADAINNTEKKLDTLKEAEKQVQAQFERGEVSEAQYRALQREIIETEAKLGKYKSAAKETADAVEKLGKEAGKAAGKIDEQADKTKEAEKATEDFDDASGDLARGGLAAVAAAAAAAVTAIVALAEESREYRTEMAKLDTAFTDNNHSAEAATKTYEALQSILGETEQSVEAANNLAALCTSEEELTDWTEILTGVYGKFGASLPVEGLAEAANETKRVGQVTGPLADALNWAAKEGETFGVKMKKATKQNEAWNKAVEEATSAEDFFNLALQECSSEQERQQLITQTLTKLYGSAATQYKKTNAEVIRSNQATEKWNKETAKIGKTVEPVITDIKELGTTLLQDAEEPLKDTAKYIQKEVIPAIKNISSWVKKNGPLIKATLVGITTALIAYKAATVATTVAHKGLKGALKATMVAEKALQLVQASSPWGLVAVAIATVTTALIAYAIATDNGKKSAELLTQEERELLTAAKETAQAFRDQKKATDEALGDITAEMRHTQDLAEELRSLADASGKVQEKDKARAELILGLLNEALGTEYTMVGDVIQKYNELKTSIDKVIQSKTANALLEAANADYIAAIQGETDAYNAAQLALDKKEEAYLAYEEARAKAIEADEAYLEAVALYGTDRVQIFEEELAAAELAEQKAWEYYGQMSADYKDLQGTYEGMQETILNYEKAQGDALQGNYQTAIDIFTKKGQLYTDYGETVDTVTAQVLAKLQKEAEDAAIKAELTKENFEKGVAGYTKEMVEEAEQGYQEALGKFASAYSDAYGLGEDFGQGLADGIKIKNGAVGAAAIAQIREAVNAAKKEAEINSPSKKTMRIGEGFGEGAEVGIEKKTKDVERAASDQAGVVLDAYRAQEVNAQKALRGVAEQQVAQQTAGQTAAATANSGVLDAILAAIKEGQILLLDGDAVVGGTANKMDSQLGRLRVLAARGAR